MASFGSTTFSREDVRSGLEPDECYFLQNVDRVEGMKRFDSTIHPAPDLAVTADLTLPALTGKDLPFAGVPSGLQMPPSHWTAAAAYSPRLIRVKSLRMMTGRNDVEASGTVTDPSGRGAYDLLIKCRSFMLGEITQLTPQTRDLKLSGSGFFALSMKWRISALDLSSVTEDLEVEVQVFERVDGEVGVDREAALSSPVSVLPDVEAGGVTLLMDQENQVRVLLDGS